MTHTKNIEPTYRLLKATPWDVAGTELFNYGNGYGYASKNSYVVDGKSYPEQVVENTPEWFERIEDTPKEEILYTAWYCPNGELGHYVCYSATQRDIDEHLADCEENTPNETQAVKRNIRKYKKECCTQRDVLRTIVSTHAYRIDEKGVCVSLKKLDSLCEHLIEWKDQALAQAKADGAREVIEKMNDFEKVVNVYDMSKDAIDDDNRMLRGLIDKCRKLLATLREDYQLKETK